MSGALAFAGFDLETERLAHEHDDSRRQRARRQDVASQHKLLGKKTTEDFARLRLVRPQDRATWHQQNLHRNGAPPSKPQVQPERSHTVAKSDRTHERPLLTARERTVSPDPASLLRRQRPQSAKPVLQHVRDSTGASPPGEVVSGTKISVRRLESCGYNPVPLTTGLLVASQSAAQLRQARRDDRLSRVLSESGVNLDAVASDETPSDDTGSDGKKRIVVYIQRVMLSESDESGDDDSGWETPGFTRATSRPTPARSAWAEDEHEGEI